MNLYNNLRTKVYLGLILGLVLIPGPVLSETWEANLDLTIPSLEIRLTSARDLRAKREIMKGWTCCYHPTLIEQVYRQQYEKSIEFKLKANRKKLLYIPPYLEPTPKQVKIFWALTVLDVLTTAHGLKHSGIKETNPLLGSSPSVGRLIIHKAVLGPYVVNNSTNRQQVIVNTLLGFAVANNMRIISKRKAW